MDNQNITNIFRTLTKPAKLIHYKLTHPAGNRARDTIIGILTFAFVLYLLFDSAPYKGIGDILLSIGLACLLSVPFVFIVSFLYPIVLKIVVWIFTPGAYLYDLCDDKINNVTRKNRPKKKAAKVNRIPKARVGIKYFIEREKRIEINHATWLGP